VSPPVREAIVVAGPGDDTRTVAGVPLLVRTVLVLQRAGIERCTVVGAPVPADPRIRCALSMAPVLEPARDDALRLVVGPGAVIDEVLVCDLVARARPGAVLEVGHASARVRIAPGSRLAANGTPRVPPPAGTLVPADASPAACESALLRALENPRDGYIDRLLYRRLSRPVTRALLYAPLSPNAITALGVTVGVAGGLLLALPGAAAVAAAVACLVVSGVLDCTDGEIARLRFAETRLGHLLDVVGDTLVHAALLAGIALRLAREGRAPDPWTLAALAFGVVAAFVAITWSELTAARRGGDAGFENRLLDGVLSPLTTRDWHVFPLAFALVDRLEWLVPAAAVGANAFWVLVVVLLRRVLGRRRGVPASGP
jgi:phosphatidylglycerophosphate synthase